jgi:hypothetical protein
VGYLRRFTWRLTISGDRQKANEGDGDEFFEVVFAGDCADPGGSAGDRGSVWRLDGRAEEEGSGGDCRGSDQHRGCGDDEAHC